MLDCFYKSPNRGQLFDGSKFAFINKDVMEVTEAEVRNAADGGFVDIVYVDPPWGDGMMKFFQSQNEKLNNVGSKKWSCSQLLDKILELSISVLKHSGVMFIEYGVKDIETLITAIGKTDFVTVCSGKTNYKAGSKWNDVYFLVLCKSGYESEFRNILTDECGSMTDYIHGLRDKGGVKMVIEALRPIILRSYGLPKVTVFDPCCGLGITAEACWHYGASFVGVELSKSRIQRATDRIKKKND